MGRSTVLADVDMDDDPSARETLEELVSPPPTARSVTTTIDLGGLDPDEAIDRLADMAAAAAGRQRLTSLCDLKKVVCGNGASGPVYRIEVEVDVRMATPLALMTFGGTPVEILWTGDNDPDNEVTVSEAASWIPSAIGPDPDGNPRFVAKFDLPPDDIPKSYGALGAAIYVAGTTNAKHVTGKLVVLSTQMGMGLAEPKA